MIIKLNHLAPKVRGNFSLYRCEWYCIKLCYKSRKKRLLDKDTYTKTQLDVELSCELSRFGHLYDVQLS